MEQTNRTMIHAIRGLFAWVLGTRWIRKNLGEYEITTDEPYVEIDDIAADSIIRDFVVVEAEK